MKKILVLILALIAALSLFSCVREQKSDGGKLKIVATLFPQYDFARSIVGDRAKVEMLLPAGIDSHSFDPSMRDAEKITDADIFVYTGSVMENWAEPFAKNAPEDCLILDVSKNIELICLDSEPGHKDKHDHSHELNVDPHIWTSPKNAKIIVSDILEAVCEKDPENEAFYRENAENYLKELDRLDSDISECVGNADKNKIYFGGKFALRYFTEHYGISYMTLYDSCSESSEPDPKAVTDMIGEMKANDIGIVFYPELCEPSAARSIADGAGAEIALFHSCHNLSKNDFEAGKTYISIMYENLAVLKEALS